MSSSGASFLQTSVSLLVKWKDVAILPTLDDIFSTLQGCRYQPSRVDGDPGAGVGFGAPTMCQGLTILLLGQRGAVHKVQGKG